MMTGSTRMLLACTLYLCACQCLPFCTVPVILDVAAMYSSLYIRTTQEIGVNETDIFVTVST